MSYTIERLENPFAILITFNEDFTLRGDHTSYTKDANAMLDDEISLIIDITRCRVSFHDLLEGTKIAQNNETKNVAKHPNVRKLILVTEAPLLNLSIEGFRKLGLPGDMRAFSSLEEALSAI